MVIVGVAGALAFFVTIFAGLMIVRHVKNAKLEKLNKGEANIKRGQRRQSVFDPELSKLEIDRTNKAEVWDADITKPDFTKGRGSATLLKPGAVAAFGLVLNLSRIS